ncbi:VOC family protein [Paenibacillus glacialis]|uniref:VOC domain-containing protein n=1 Tax=Paenibacillus glacialis TaxID=494026 RepID=A0A162KED7_9BACL|nr:glyoxalase/bleomycin resistance/dioxygenase family protein [Paenibacillus glacialis]OAB45318.1 hypothetical protein PGLA_03425 [Paenibacillus glacialis]
MKIEEIRLYTEHLDAVKDFYSVGLELPIMESSNTSITFLVGLSRLTFVQSDTVANPYYHFAFNIVEDKNQLAIEWLKSRGINISQVDDHDESYSESWNSHSIYFYDSVGNIVEFIARHNQKHESYSEFTYKDILNISEIGLPSEDVIELSTYIQEQYDEQMYLSGSPTFTPIGDEEGLFIVSIRQRIWLGSNKEAEIFPLEIVINQGKPGTKQLLQYPYKIITI